MPDPLLSLIIAAGLTIIGLFAFWPESGAFWRWQRTREMTERVLREDALKHIIHCENHAETLSLKSLAGALNSSTGQAADVIESMQSLDLIEAEGTTFRLTPEGRDYALRILRAHRLYERYLAEETGYDETDWHNKAHQREHHLSPEDIENLAVQLGNPTHDPHGDPIPMADGTVVYSKDRTQLGDLSVDTSARIVHLEDEPKEVYAQLIAEGLHIGQEIRLLEVSPKRVRFWSENDEHVLAPILTANIAVIPVSEKSEEVEIPGEPLTNLKPGQEARVMGLSSRIRGAERRRLMDLGLLPGTSIQAEMESAGGDPIAYRVRGALIALRKSQARLINICPDGSEC